MTKSVKKINVKERVDDDTIDLSLSDISEIPVKDIANHKRATNLDLSNNKIVSLGSNFAILSHLVKLDLSKNQIIHLPDSMGKLVHLRHLDLFNNKLVHLPLEMGKMRSLRYLDLKGNPLTPGLLKVVGHCLTVKECQLAAKTIVPFLTQLQIQVYEERDTLLKQKAEHQAEQKRLLLESELRRLARAETEVNGHGGEQQEPAPKKPKPKRERKNKNAMLEQQTLDAKSSGTVDSDQYDANLFLKNHYLKLFICVALMPIVALFLIYKYGNFEDDGNIAYFHDLVRPVIVNFYNLFVLPLFAMVLKGFAILMDFNHTILEQLSTLISS